MARWGGFEPDFSDEDFVAGDILSFGGLLRVGVHSSVPGVDRDEVWESRIPADFGGVPTSFASLDALIAMKEAAGRKEKDLPDLRRLRLLRDRRGKGDA